MPRKSSISCRACERVDLPCDKKKPSCCNCIAKNINCRYPLNLHWGGRPYKNKQKVLNIPLNTKLVNGILKVKNKNVFVRHNAKSRDLILINENSSLSKSFEIEESFGNQQSSCGVVDQNSNAHIKLPMFLEGDNDFHNHRVSQRLDIDRRSRFQNESSTECTSKQLVFIRGSSKENDELVDDAYSCIRSLDMSTPSLELLRSSEKHWNLFNFYMNKTSHLLVLLSCQVKKSNPFRTILPRLALHSPTLLKLLLAFGGQHSMQLKNINGDELFPIDYPADNGMLSKALFDESVTELVINLENHDSRLSDFTLANILMLANYSLYISNAWRNWKTHYFGAKGIIMSKLAKDRNSHDTVMYITNEQAPYIFLQRWFAWMDIIGVLSSPKIALQTQYTFDLKFDFTSLRKDQSLVELRKEFSDIEYTTGMEVEVLSLIARTCTLLVEKEKERQNRVNSKLIICAIELDYEILDYLESSEKERDTIWKYQQMKFKLSSSDDLVKNYFLLRATNLIYGLTGVLQIRRRVIGMPQDCKLVVRIIRKISLLIKEKLPLKSPGLGTIAFCLFCCGCELIDESLVPFRKIYLDRFQVLEINGVSCATPAKRVMKECWKSKKCWWDIIKEQNLELSFAL